MTELTVLSAVELRRLIGSGEVSPVELLAACRQRVERLNPALNAVVTTCWDRAERESHLAETAVRRSRAPLGALHGLPIAIKDLEETEGVRTTFGSPLFSDHVPAQDDAVVAALRRAGAIVVGKTNTPEFGAGGHTTNAVFGPTRNPFDRARSAGGSSGGSAAAVASRLVPIASGSDTGGSLRIPAAFCGVVGFRPSPGLVPQNRRPFGWSPLPVLGPLARDVPDAALLLSGMIAFEPLDPLSLPVAADTFAAVEQLELERLRAVFSEDLGFAAVAGAIRSTFRERSARIDDWFAATSAELPCMRRVDALFAILRGESYLARYKQLWAEQRAHLGPNIVENYRQALTFSADDIAWAHAEQTRLFRAFQAFFADCDLLITPAVPVLTFPVEERTVESIEGVPMRSYFHWLALTYGLTLIGHPVISIPCGRAPDGTPFGLQICAGRGQDRLLLAAAHTLMQRFAGDLELARPEPVET